MEVEISAISISMYDRLRFGSYLKEREAVFSHHHPQWNLTNEEISSSSDLLKRDGTPICIPPSWDLAQKYVGPDDERADGISQRGLKLRQRFSGDPVEAAFHRIFGNLKIGGVLVGDVDSTQFLGTDKFEHDSCYRPMPATVANIFKEDIMRLDFQKNGQICHCVNYPCVKNDRKEFSARL
jgi:hypothetical protein